MSKSLVQRLSKQFHGALVAASRTDSSTQRQKLLKRAAKLARLAGRDSRIAKFAL